MIVWVYTGFASRCVTLAHAYHLVKRYSSGGGLVVIWPRDNMCNISYKKAFSKEQFADIDLKVIEVDLTEPHSIPDYLIDHKYLDIAREIKKRAKRAAFNVWVGFLKRNKKYIDYDYNYKRMTAEERGIHLAKCWNECERHLAQHGHENLFIHAYVGIVKGQEADKIASRTIRFHEKYMEKANRIMAGSGNYVGVHIRRTDHNRAIKCSTDKAFIQKMDEALNRDRNIRFFLSTDDPAEEKKFLKRYKDNIIVQKNKNWGRNSAKEMGSGIIDLICLSRCDYILGSYTSVFSFFASKYGECELVICKEDA